MAGFTRTLKTGYWHQRISFTRQSFVVCEMCAQVVGFLVAKTAGVWWQAVLVYLLSVVAFHVLLIHVLKRPLDGILVVHPDDIRSRAGVEAE